MHIRLIYTIAVAVAGLLALLATFLPWVSLDVEISLLGSSGSIGTITRYGYDGDGVITFFSAFWPPDSPPTSGSNAAPPPSG